MLSLAAFAYSPPAPIVHADRAANIAKVNAANTTWTAKAHPRFSSDAPGASKPLMGVLGSWADEIREKVAAGEIERYTASENFVAPAEFDSATNWPECATMIDDIRDQSNCGCCWAFGGAEAASDRMCIASKATLIMPLSAQDVCFNSNRNGCGGGQISTPWNFIKSSGVVTGGQYQGSGPFGGDYCSDFSLPHCHHHGPQGDDPYPGEGEPGCPSERSPTGPKACDSDASSEHSDFKADKYTYSGRTQSASGVANIQAMISEGGPVETAFTVYEDFEDYDGGIYKHVTGGMAGGHAVKIVGWGSEDGTNYWKVANSWNPYWGEKGYFRIAYGEGGIDDEVIGSSADSTWGKK
jgi:cathepsin B